MANRQDLKRKLKAADRRRSRRPNPPAASSAITARPSTDVPELIANSILEHADSIDDEIRDVIVVSAMRSCLNGIAANGEQSIPLCQRLEQIPARADVSRRSFRAALQQMLRLASEHKDPKEPIAFIRYLAMLAR